MFLWDRRARDLITTDEMELKLTSEKITKRAREMISALESEFPAAAISFKVCLDPSLQHAKQAP